MFSLDVRDDVNHEETTVKRRPHDCSMSHFDTAPARDRRTDGRTERQTDFLSLVERSAWRHMLTRCQKIHYTKLHG